MQNLIMYALLHVLKNPLCPFISMKLKHCKLQHNWWDKKRFEGDLGDQVCSKKPSHRHKFVFPSFLWYMQTSLQAHIPQPSSSFIKVFILVKGRLALWKNCSLHECLHHSTISNLRKVWILRAHWWVVLVSCRLGSGCLESHHSV